MLCLVPWRKGGFILSAASSLLPWAAWSSQIPHKKELSYLSCPRPLPNRTVLFLFPARFPSSIPTWDLHTWYPIPLRTQMLEIRLFRVLLVQRCRGPFSPTLEHRQALCARHTAKYLLDTENQLRGAQSPAEQKDRTQLGPASTLSWEKRGLLPASGVGQQGTLMLPASKGPPHCGTGRTLRFHCPLPASCAHAWHCLNKAAELSHSRICSCVS